LINLNDFGATVSPSSNDIKSSILQTHHELHSVFPCWRAPMAINFSRLVCNLVVILLFYLVSVVLSLAGFPRFSVSSLVFHSCSLTLPSAFSYMYHDRIAWCRDRLFMYAGSSASCGCSRIPVSLLCICEHLSLYLRTSDTTPSVVLRPVLALPVPVVYTPFSLVPHDRAFTVFGPVGTLVVLLLSRLL
jgi:hypothetical protein